MSICSGSSCSKHSCPDFGRSLPLSCQILEVELAFANAMHELDSSNCRSGGSEAFQAQHRS